MQGKPAPSEPGGLWEGKGDGGKEMGGLRPCLCLLSWPEQLREDGIDVLREEPQ